MNTDEVTFSVTLKKGQAYALAELCKRIGWDDAAKNAVSYVETELMLSAMDRVRNGLEAINITVR